MLRRRDPAPDRRLARAVSCLDGDTNACPRAGQCSTLPMWEKLDRLINGYLDSVRLSDLLGEDATKL